MEEVKRLAKRPETALKWSKARPDPTLREPEVQAQGPSSRIRVELRQQGTG